MLQGIALARSPPPSTVRHLLIGHFAFRLLSLAYIAYATAAAAAAAAAAANYVPSHRSALP